MQHAAPRRLRYVVVEPLGVGEAALIVRPHSHSTRIAPQARDIITSRAQLTFRLPCACKARK